METHSPQLSVAVCQLTSIDDLEANTRKILGLLAELENDVPDLVCFPENALYLRVREGTSIEGLSLDHPSLLKLADWAKKYRSNIHLGSVPLRVGSDLFNSSLLIREDGTISDSYHKIHLFDVDVVGHKPVRESDVFTHGEGPSVIELKGWKIGSTICYDLRFSELFHYYARLGVDALLIPSAFLVPTGQAHWHVLTRARAIECQAYVLAAAQGGSHVGASGGTRKTYGHSVVIGPWGEILAECPEDFGDDRILRVVLERETIESVRKQIPMKNHRRLGQQKG